MARSNMPDGLRVSAAKQAITEPYGTFISRCGACFQKLLLCGTARYGVRHCAAAKQSLAQHGRSLFAIRQARTMSRRPLARTSNPA
jgi:hypothetical protein